MMRRLGIPELLLVLAAAFAAFGIGRLLPREACAPHRTQQAFIVWVVLLTAGISVWLLAAFHVW